MTDMTVLNDLLSRQESLPEMPAIALQCIQLLDNEETDAHDLAKVVMLDPALVSQILKVCNSARYALNRRVGTLSEAIAILGQQALKQIIYTIISHGVLNRPVVGYALEKGDLWHNAVTGAIYARFLAQRFVYRDPELAFIAAILRDLGKLMLERAVGHQVSKLQAYASAHKLSFGDSEDALVGVSHMELGARLAGQWNLPVALCESIRYHHQPSHLPAEAAEDTRRLVSLVHLADTYALLNGNGLGVDGLMYPLDAAIFPVLNLAPESLVLEQLYADLLSLDPDIQAICHGMTAS